MAYTIKFKTFTGRSRMISSPNFEDIETQAKACVRYRRPAKIYKDEIEIGKVWKDPSQITGWNYFIQKD